MSGSGSSDEETEEQQNRNSKDPEPLQAAGASQDGALPASQSQSKTNRTWMLDRGVGFQILEFAITEPGKPMNIKMEFELPNGVKKIVDIPFTDDAMKRSRKICVNKIGKGIWLHDLPTHFQDKYFPDFLEQQLQLFDAENDPAEKQNRKPIMEFHSPRVEKIGEKYYWVAGQSEVHHLNHLKSEEANYYSMKLSKEEIEELPVVIIYTGFDQNSYSNDEEKAFAILLEIIALMNSMQDPLWHSFPLASFCIHVGSQLYVVIQTEQGRYITSIVLSGSGNTARTGKSLMTSTWQNAFLGCIPQDQLIRVTESSLFEELENGRTVFLREWTKQTGTVINTIIPVVWEKLGRNLNKKPQRVKAVVLIEGNLDPEDLKLLGANKSKVNFVYTGPALSNLKQKEICKKIVSLGTQLNKYKPVMLALGLNGLLAEITDEEIDAYEHLVENRDDRAGQVLLNYDRIYNALESAITEHNLIRPPLFKGYIDRNALTKYSGKQDIITPEEMAEQVANYLVEEKLKNCVQCCQRSSNFKIKLGISDIPPEISTALKNTTKETSTTFKGRPRIKVRIMSAELLSDESVAKLKKLSRSLDFFDCLQEAVYSFEEYEDEVGQQFYEDAIAQNRRGKRTLPPRDAYVEDMFEAEEAGPSKKTRRGPVVGADPQNDFTCYVLHCPGQKNNYKNASSFKRHLLTKAHISAEKKLAPE